MQLNTCLRACTLGVFSARHLIALLVFNELEEKVYHPAMFCCTREVGKPRSQEVKEVQGSAARKAKRALSLQSCSAFFMADPPCFTGNTHITALQPKPVYCGHVVVLPLRGRTADTSLSHSNSYPFKSSWLKYINPPVFVMPGDRLADVFNI